MEFNFIEEVSKALDVLTVERLVRTSPMGSVRCKPCNKRLYTYTQARYAILRRMQDDDGVHMDLYPCQAQEGENYHLTDIDKKIESLTKAGWFRSQLVQKKNDLDRKREITSNRSTHQHRVTENDSGGRRPLLVGVFSGQSYPKALRTKIVRALVIPLSGLRKPHPHLLRRRFKPGRRLPGRWEPRRDFPQGETVTKMLSWANSHKFHVDSEHRSCRPRGDGAEFRRRNRAREAEAVRREAEREIVALEPLDGPEEWHQHRCSTNMAAINSVDFDGCYTSSTE